MKGAKLDFESIHNVSYFCCSKYSFSFYLNFLQIIKFEDLSSETKSVIKFHEGIIVSKHLEWRRK